jgi:hypothetical protein
MYSLGRVKDIVQLTYDKSPHENKHVDLWDRGKSVLFWRTKYLVIDYRLPRVLFGRLWFDWEQIETFLITQIPLRDIE